jgi:hypothetical protein
MIKTFTLNSTSNSTSNNANNTSSRLEQLTIVKAAKYFKYELIKVLIFLLLFGASVFFVNSASHEYYHQNEKSSLMEK